MISPDTRPTRRPEPEAPIRLLTEADAQAYKDLFVALLAEFPQDGDAQAERAKPVESYARMMAHTRARGGIYLGLFREGALAAFSGLLHKNGDRVVLFGPSALPEARDPAILIPLVSRVFEHATLMHGVRFVVTEIDPNISHMRHALVGAGFTRYGYINDERRVNGKSFDAELLLRRVQP